VPEDVDILTARLVDRKISALESPVRSSNTGGLARPRGIGLATPNGGERRARWARRIRNLSRRGRRGKGRVAAGVWGGVRGEGFGVGLVRNRACSAVAWAARSFYDAGMVERAILLVGVAPVAWRRSRLRWWVFRCGWCLNGSGSPACCCCPLTGLSSGAKSVPHFCWWAGWRRVRAPLPKPRHWHVLPRLFPAASRSLSSLLLQNPCQWEQPSDSNFASAMPLFSAARDFRCANS
jgi:hypothetical protein